MVGERLRYTIEAVDKTQDATVQVERRVSNSFKRLATRAGIVGAALAVEFAAAVDVIESRVRRLRIATGGGGEETQALLARLTREGLDDEPAVAGIAALQGQASLLGVDRLNEGVALALGQTTALGGDARLAAQGLAQFGVRGAPDVRGSLELANTQALAANIDVGQLHTALRDYGPVLAAFGLNYLEAAAFILDLTQQGIDVSRVSPALNRFIRDASASGRSARQEGVAAFDAIRRASPIAAAALGQEYFGAEGGLRLTSAIRSGQVGLGGELAIDPAILEAQSLTSVLRPTTRERFGSFLGGIAFDPEQDFLTRAVASGFRSTDKLPFGIGDAFAQAGGELIEFQYGDLTGNLNELPEVRRLLERQNQLLEQQIGRQDQQLELEQRIASEGSFSPTRYGLDTFLRHNSVADGGQ